MAGGLGTILGYPQVTNWFDPRRSQLLALASGLASSPDFGQAVSNGFAGAAQAKPADDAYAASLKADAERLKAINQTTNYLQRQAATDPRFADLLSAVQSGAISPADAYSTALSYKYPKPGDPFTLGPGETRYAANGNVLASVPTAPKSESLPSSYQEYLLSKSDPGYAASLSSSSTKPPTTDQSNAGGFADRMKAAEQVLQQTETVQTDQGQALKNMVPGAGNYLVSPEYQQAMQAQRDFVNAILRKESGAAISNEEFDNARKQYFPQPGDSPQVIEQKRQNRAIAIASMERSAGPSYGRAALTNAANDPLGIR